MKVLIGILFIFGVVISGFASDNSSLTHSSHTTSVFYGINLEFFGSKDDRFGGGFSYSYGRPERQFRLDQIPAQFVLEGYVNHTQTPGVGTTPPNDTFAAGALGYARWIWPLDKKTNSGVYVDLGWGIQVENIRSYDLDSLINSTPVLDIGGIYQMPNQEFMIGLRYLHISNAGLVGRNRGQNELSLVIGLRY